MPLNIPNICQFWDIATLLRPVNSTPKSANQNCTLHTLQRGEGELGWEGGQFNYFTVQNIPMQYQKMHTDTVEKMEKENSRCN